MIAFLKHEPGPWSMAATTDDIRQCFRIFLGREPAPEEWPGHSSRAGEPLMEVARSFASSRECADRGLFATARQEAAENDVEFISVGNPAVVVVARRSDIDVGKHVLAGAYEPHVTAVFERCLRPDMNVVDVGANCGYFTSLALAGVGPGGHVWAIEPNPDNVRLLELARRRNSARNVTIVPAAVSNAFGAARLYASSSNGMIGPLRDSDAVTSVAAQITLDGLMSSVVNQRMNLIKIDVEGYEGLVLDGANRLLADHRPLIVVEFTPNSLVRDAGPDVLSVLRRHDYVISVIEPDSGPTDQLTDAEILALHARRGIDHLDLFASPS